MCMVYDGEPATISRLTKIKAARKQHTCNDCGRNIQTGEPYTHGVWFYEGYWSSLNTCQHCLAAATWLTAACEGFLFGSIQEDLEEHWEESWEYRSVTLGRLIIGIRRKWRDGAEPVPDAAVVRASVPVAV